MVHFLYLPWRLGIPRGVYLFLGPLWACVILAIKKGPLLLWRDFGSPNRGIISFKGDLQMSLTSSDCMWKYQQMPEDVYIMTVGTFGWNLTASVPPDKHLGVGLTWIMKGGIQWVCGLLWAHKSQACITYFTVLLNSFTEKTFCIKSLSTSLPEWVALCKFLVSLHCWASGIRILSSFLVSACYSLLIAPFLSMFLFLCGILVKAREFWGTNC